MQAHHKTTLFILGLIAVLAIGSYVFLQTVAPYQPPPLQNTFPPTAELDEVFSKQAEPVVPPAPGSATDTSGLVGEPWDEHDGDVVAALTESEADPASEDGYADPYAAFADEDPYADDAYAEDDTPSDAGQGAAADTAGASSAAAADESWSASEPEPVVADEAQAHEEIADADAYADDYHEDDYGAAHDAGAGTAGSDGHAKATTPAAPATAARTPAEAVAAQGGGGTSAPRSRHVEPIPRPRGDAPPAADAVHQWWPSARAVPKGRFMLVHAGPSADGRHITLVFSRPVAPDALDRHARVIDDKGKVVPGSWRAGESSRVALFPVRPGRRYTVVLPAELSDTSGRQLGVALSGPVWID